MPTRRGTRQRKNLSVDSSVDPRAAFLEVTGRDPDVDRHIQKALRSGVAALKAHEEIERPAFFAVCELERRLDERSSAINDYSKENGKPARKSRVGELVREVNRLRRRADALRQ